MTVRQRTALLDVVAEVLVADPSASLSEVAEAAGIGRTTLHKHYATRDDLIRAVGFRALDLWAEAISVVGETDPDGGLRALIAALIPIGPQLAFLWRTPAFDRDDDIKQRWHAVENRLLGVLGRAQEKGLLAADAADWWLLETFHALIYVGAECVSGGDLAPRDAPDRVLRMYLHGIGSSTGGQHDEQPHPGNQVRSGSLPAARPANLCRLRPA
jgi:AcrR family transcriptional regulator